MQRGLPQEFTLGDRRQTYYIEMVQIKERKSASSYHFSNIAQNPSPFRTFVSFCYDYLKRTRHFDTFRCQQLHLHSSKEYVEDRDCDVDDKTRVVPSDPSRLSTTIFFQSHHVISL